MPRWFQASASEGAASSSRLARRTTSSYCRAANEADQNVQFPPLGLRSGAHPHAADAVFRQRADGAVVVQQGAAEAVIVLEIAEEAQGEDGAAADLPPIVSHQALQGAGAIALRHGGQKARRIPVFQVMLVESQQPWCSGIVAHALIPLPESCSVLV